MKGYVIFEYSNGNGEEKIKKTSGRPKTSTNKCTADNSVRHVICSLISSYSVLVCFVDCIGMLFVLQGIIAQHQTRHQFNVNLPFCDYF